MVIDGMGSGRNRCLIDDCFLPLKLKNLNPGNIYNEIGKVMELDDIDPDNHEKFNDQQGPAGKVMGLINLPDLSQYIKFQ